MAQLGIRKNKYPHLWAQAWGVAPCHQDAAWRWFLMLILLMMFLSPLSRCYTRAPRKRRPKCSQCGCEQVGVGSLCRFAARSADHCLPRYLQRALPGPEALIHSKHVCRSARCNRDRDPVLVQDFCDVYFHFRWGVMNPLIPGSTNMPHTHTLPF